MKTKRVTSSFTLTILTLPFTHSLRSNNHRRGLSVVNATCCEGGFYSLLAVFIKSILYFYSKFPFMTLEHVAIWTSNLEVLKEYYVKYFGAVSNEIYINPVSHFSSYFLAFESGAR